MFNTRLIISLFLLGLIVSPVNAQEKPQSVVGRYLTVSQKPLVGQTDLLSQTFEVRFQNNINTIWDAIDYLLRFSGYRLVGPKLLCPEAQSLMTQPLPEVDRNLGPLSLKEGLLTLAGTPFQLIVDPVQDMQNSEKTENSPDGNIKTGASLNKNSHLDLDFAHLIKQEAKNTDDKKDKMTPVSNDPLFALKSPDIKKINPAVPYYTIPVNATLTGAIAMQPIIGRIPINGKVPDPYTFKVIIGPKNLAANGIDMPEDLQGIVASGIAEGDLLGSCARGDIRSMTFVFTDGRINTTESKDNQTLGTIAAANGNPCIQGSFHTDAPLFLGATAGLAGLQGYGNALSQSQLNHVTTPDGSTISSILGSANKYAFGQGFSAAAQASQKWWDDRVQSSFDFVYVPNVDLKTGEKLKLNINITQEIAIDYDPQKRKVFYAHDKDSSRSALD